MSQARTIAQRYFAFKVLSSALQEYGNANNGQFPTELAQLASYFESPVDSSVLDGWEIVPGRSLPRDLRVEEAWVITQKAPINAELDQRIVVGLRGVPIR